MVISDAVVMGESCSLVRWMHSKKPRPAPPAACDEAHAGTGELRRDPTSAPFDKAQNHAALMRQINAPAALAHRSRLTATIGRP